MGERRPSRIAQRSAMRFRNKFFTTTSITSAAVLSVALFAPPALAAETTEIINTDFQDDSWQEAWEKSGEPELSVVELDGSDVLRVQDRAQDFDGIKSKAGLFADAEDRKSTRLNSSHVASSYAVFCLKK